MVDFYESARKTREKANRIEYLGDLYTVIEDKRKWDAMIYHPADDEHSESWFTAPEPDDYQYAKYQACCEVLEAIEKLVK